MSVMRPRWWILTLLLILAAAACDFRPVVHPPSASGDNAFTPRTGNSASNGRADDLSPSGTVSTDSGADPDACATCAIPIGNRDTDASPEAGHNDPIPQ